MIFDYSECVDCMHLVIEEVISYLVTWISPRALVSLEVLQLLLNANDIWTSYSIDSACDARIILFFESSCVMWMSYLRLQDASLIKMLKIILMLSSCVSKERKILQSSMRILSTWEFWGIMWRLTAMYALTCKHQYSIALKSHSFNFLLSSDTTRIHD